MKYAPYQDYYTQQIAAYTIQAGEILSKEVGETNANFRRMFLPQGPELYTGPLKTAGYLLLDPQIDHIILINKQSKYPEEITMLEEKEGIVALGKQYKIIALALEGTRKTTKIDSELLHQLNFFTMLKTISKITVLGVGKDVNFVELAQKIKTITKSKKIGIIYYDTCADQVSHEKARQIDELAMKNILRSKVSTVNNVESRLANLFIMTLPKKIEPQLIGYVNTGDFGGDQKKTTSYASLIG